MQYMHANLQTLSTDLKHVHERWPCYQTCSIKPVILLYEYVLYMPQVSSLLCIPLAIGAMGNMHAYRFAARNIPDVPVYSV